MNNPPLRILGLVLILMVLPQLSDPKPKSSLPENGTTLAAQRLASILEKQSQFLKNASVPTQPLAEEELTRQAQEIVSAYESYLSDNEKDVHALILYGKFLKRMGQPRQAAGLFLEADKADSKLAVVKQHLGNYLVEEGRPADALPYLLKAAELEPEEPVYHHQLGTFLFLFGEDLTKLGITTMQTNAETMHKAFETASRLSPQNFDYGLRYAQSFFDVSKPNWQKAMGVWKRLRLLANGRPAAEKEYLSLGEARVLIESGRPREARAILKNVKSPSLRSTRENLFKRLDQKLQTEKSVPSESSPQGSLFRKNAFPATFPDRFIDENLRRLRQVSERLHEERLLQELQADAVRASYNRRGEVRLHIKGLAEANHVKKHSTRRTTQ